MCIGLWHYKKTRNLLWHLQKDKKFIIHNKKSRKKKKQYGKQGIKSTPLDPIKAIGIGTRFNLIL